MTTKNAKRIHLIKHPAERAIERGVPVEEVERIVRHGVKVPDYTSHYPNTTIAIGRFDRKHWSIPYTEQPGDIFVITVRPSRKDEVSIYKKETLKSHRRRK